MRKHPIARDAMALPLPIDALLRRARNAKSPKERHDVAYFAWEASVRLAVAAAPPDDRSWLAVPSVGDLVRALDVPDDKRDDSAVLAAYALFEEVGSGRQRSPRSVSPRKLADALPAYRNAAVGHGSVRAPEFYDPASDVLRTALEWLWSERVFWPPGARLTYIESVELDETGERRARAFDVMGPAATIIEPRGVTGFPQEILPRRLYLRDGEQLRPLHPWVVFFEADLQERVLFFNGRRKSPRYLDYVGGEELRGRALDEAFPGIRGDVDEMLAGTVPIVESDEPGSAAPRLGDYELLGKLGEGGMGIVYMARQSSLDRLVALKTLPPSLADDAVAVARFRREVQALGRCEHPHVVKILASGIADGQHYYAMELIQGADLGELMGALANQDDFDMAVSTASDRMRKARDESSTSLPRVRPRPPARDEGPGPDRISRLVELFRDAARGVEHLHEQGVIHRDLKPGNLMITESDHRVVVMDLGLAMVGDASQSITRDRSQILGTLRYMPPEQLQRNLLQLDRRADVYSLGATFYELLTKTPFFDGDSEVRLIEQVLHEDPVAPQTANPELPQDVAIVLQKATQKDAKLRYDTAEGLAGDLEAYLDGRPIGARPPSLGYVLRLTIARHKAVATAVIVLIIMATAGIGFYVQQKAGALNEELARRQEAERLRAEADKYRTVAEKTLVPLLEELGRSKLLEGDEVAAVVYLSEAFTLGGEGPALRLLLGESMRSVDDLVLEITSKRGPILATGFVRNGELMYTSAGDGTVELWDATTGSQLQSMRGNDRLVTSFVVSEDGRRVVTSTSEGALEFWSGESGTLEHSVRARTETRQLMLSPDGSMLAALGSLREGHEQGERDARDVVDLWDVEEGEVTTTLSHTGWINGAEFSPDGATLVTAGSTDEVFLWDLQSGESGKRLGDGELAAAGSATFSPDGRLLLTGTTSVLAGLWSVQSGAYKGGLPHARKLRVSETAFSPDGRLAAVGAPPVVSVWDVAEQTGVVSLEVGWIDDLQFDRAGQVLLVEAGPYKSVYDARSGARLAQLPMADPTQECLDAEISPDGRHIAELLSGGSVNVWKLGSFTDPRVGDAAPASAMAPSPDGQSLVVGHVDGTLSTWDTRGRRKASVGKHAAEIHDVEFSADGNQIVAASKDGTVRVWPQSGGEAVSVLQHEAAVVQVALAEDGARIATRAQDGSASIWEGRLRLARLTPSVSIADVAINRDGSKVATVGGDGTLRVWDADQGSIVHELSDNAALLTLCRFSPDGNEIVTGAADGSIALWSAESGTRLKSFDQSASVTALAFSPAGSELVTGSADNSVKVWDLKEAKLEYSLHGHSSPVTRASFSPNGEWLLTDPLVATHMPGPSDTTARIWDMETGRLLLTLSGHVGAVADSAFLRNATRVVTLGQDGTARLWTLRYETREPAEVAAIVERVLPARLVAGQLQRDADTTHPSASASAPQPIDPGLR